MENVVNFEAISYFSNEILCLIGIILNLFLFLFFKQKFSIKRLSDTINASIFLLDGCFLGTILINSKINFQNLDLCFLNNTFLINEKILVLGIIINIFMFIFSLGSYKISRKAQFKVPVVNSFLLFITAFSSLIIKSQNFLLTYFLLEGIIFFSYKYASFIRFRKDNIYSKSFVLISFCSSLMFFSFYILSLFIKNTIQLNIIEVMIALALLLKTGFFPIYNYLSTLKNKINLPYSILIYGFIPFISIVSFYTFLNNINLTNQTFQITLSLFLCSTILAFSFFSFKTKNIVKFFGGVNLIYSCVLLTQLILLRNEDFALKASICYLFIFLSLGILFNIFKFNYKINKLTISNLKGFYFENDLLINLITANSLFLFGLFPNIITKINLLGLKNIYLFDKMTFFISTITVISFILVLLGGLKIIGNFYLFNKEGFKKVTYTSQNKRTAFNITVPIVTMILYLIFYFIN